MIDWNGNGRLDPWEIAVALAMLEEEALSESEEEQEEMPSGD